MNDLIIIGIAGAGFLAVIGHMLLKKLPSRKANIAPANTGTPVYTVDPSELRFTQRPLLNKSEHRLWIEIEGWRVKSSPRLTLSAQVSYGEFLSSQRTDHYRAINTKRADIVLWDDHGMVRAVIEYDGRGHWGDTPQDADRAQHADLLKNRALASAGIPLLRVNSGYTHSDLVANLNVLLSEYMPDLVPQPGTQAATA